MLQPSYMQIQKEVQAERTECHRIANNTSGEIPLEQREHQPVKVVSAAVAAQTSLCHTLYPTNQFQRAGL